MLVRMMFFVCGVHYVTVKGRRVSSREAPILCLSPHSSFLDVLVGFIAGLPCTVSTKTNAQMPIVGGRYYQPYVLVCTCMYAHHVYTCMYVHHVCTCMYTHNVCMYMYVYTPCMYVHVCIHTMYVCTCMYTHHVCTSYMYIAVVSV